MSKDKLFIQSAFLSNKNRLSSGFLSSDKISDHFQTNPYLFYLIEINSTGTGAIKAKRSIISILERKHKEYGLKLNEQSFERILETINSALDKLVQDGEKDWLGKINATIGLIVEDNLYLSQTGNICGYMFRKNNISEILKGQNTEKIPLPINTFTDIINGQLANADRLVIGNCELFNNVSVDMFRKIVIQDSARQAAKNVYELFKKNKITGISAIFFEAKTQEQSINEEIDEIQDKFYIDQMQEDFATKVHDNIVPVYEMCQKKAITLCSCSKKYCKIFYHFIKEKWNKTLKPYSTKFFSLSKKNASKLFSITEEKIAPNLAKISDKYAPKFKTPDKSGILKKISSSLSLYITNLSKLVKTLLQPRNRKYLYTALLIMFFSFGYMKVKHNNEHREEIKRANEIAESYEKSEKLFEQAKSDIALGKPEGSSKLIESMTLAQKSMESPSNKNKAESLVTEIRKAIDSMSKTARLSNSKSLISYDYNISRILLVNSDIYALTKEGKILRNANYNGTPKLVSSLGTDRGEATDMTYQESSKLIYFPTTTKKILSLDTESDTVSEISLDVDTTKKYSNITSLSTFSTNLYLLDAETGQLWKYAKNDSGYGKGTLVISSDKANIRGAIDMSIDGSIYILQNNGGITKITRGTATTVEYKNMPTGFTEILQPYKIFTDENTNYIFILDKKDGRIIRFNKNGEYVSQYVIDDKKIDDFEVNGKLQKIYALSENKIYELDF